MRLRRTGLTAAVAGFLSFPLLAWPEAPAPTAAPGKLESFKFTITGGLSQIGRREERSVTVEKWTTPDDARALAAVRVAKGDEAVTEQLLRWRAGVIRRSVASDPTAFGGAGRFPSGTSTTGGAPVYVATSHTDQDGRRRVRLLVNLPGCLGMLKPSHEEPLPDHGIVELELDAQGKGISGRLVQAPAIAFDADGQLARDPASPLALTWTLVGVKAYD